jgi:hypothetical protein
MLGHELGHTRVRTGGTPQPPCTLHALEELNYVACPWTKDIDSRKLAFDPHRPDAHLVRASRDHVPFLHCSLE